MPPCKFYLQGYCKFGDRCKFDHPGANNQARANQQNQNRFSALSNSNPGGQAARGGQRGGPRQENKYNLDPATIKQDLTGDRPIWPFSVYAPARYAARQLIEGPIMEQSPEEMRLRCYAAMRTGNPQQAAQEETQLLGQMNQQIQNIISNLDGACMYVQDGDNVHPNRLDVCEQASSAQGQPQQQQAGALGQANATFGQPSAFGSAAAAAAAAARPPQGTAFGQPSAFGAAASQQQSAFGRPSAFGAAANQQSAFGSPSPLGGANQAFGKPAFGAPSAFGQTANAGSAPGAAPAFGQPSQPGGFGQPGGQPGGAFGAKPAFGQPAGGAAFGQPSQPGSTGAFGQPSQPGGTGAFGKPTGTPGFGQSAFGQPAQPAASSPFGQLGQQQQQSGGFRQPANQSSATGAFGQQQPTASPFGQAAGKPSPFGAPSQPSATSAFGSPAQPATASPFGQPATNGFAAPQANGFGQPQQQQPSLGNIGVPGVAAGADVSTYTTRSANNQLTSFKGQPVQYINQKPCYRRPDDGQWERIWLPDGAPPENVYCHAEPQVYGEVLREAYEYLSRSGTFKDGVMPEEPPPHALCGFDV